MNVEMLKVPEHIAPADLGAEVQRLLDSGEVDGDKVVVLRGASALAPTELIDAMRTFSEQARDYVGGNSPRTNFGEGVFTASEYSPSSVITNHQELSYESSFPRHLIFVCGAEAELGGESTLVDAVELARRLDPEVLKRFVDRGLRYVERFGGPGSLGPKLENVFPGMSRQDIDAWLPEHEAEGVWGPDGDLTIVRRRDAVRTTRQGERLWFNQADQWHPSYIGSERKRRLVEQMSGGLPHDVTFRDGTPIDDEYFVALREAVAEIEVLHEWRYADVVLVRNVRIMHGRRPYRGDRRIFLTMVGEGQIEF